MINNYDSNYSVRLLINPAVFKMTYFSSTTVAHSHWLFLELIPWWHPAVLLRHPETSCTFALGMNGVTDQPGQIASGLKPLFVDYLQ